MSLSQVRTPLASAHESTSLDREKEGDDSSPTRPPRVMFSMGHPMSFDVPSSERCLGGQVRGPIRPRRKKKRERERKEEMFL